MIEFSADKPELAMTLDGAAKVTFTAPKGKLSALTELADGKTYDVTIKQHREHRSLDSNAYAWSLITQIADALLANKQQVYEGMLVKYGQSETVSVLSSINISGYFKYYAAVGNSTLNGKEFTHYRVYKGSSEFDTKEMSVFLDGIVSDAQDLGIDTRTPDEIAEMKSLWKQEGK